MKVSEKTVSIFIASDGKEFLIEKQCLDYEKNVISRLDKIKYFNVNHGADFTEGRGYFSSSLIAVEAEYSDHKEWLQMYCQLKFGPRVGWMYYNPAECWSFSQIDKSVYFDSRPKNGKKIFLSHSDMDGYPVSVKLDSNTKKENL